MRRSDGQSTFGVGGPYFEGSLAIAGAVRQGDGRLIVVGDTDLADGDRDLFVTACRPAPPLACSWEAGFGPLDASIVRLPVAGTSLSATPPAGTYYVRVYAVGGPTSMSRASNETVIVVP